MHVALVSTKAGAKHPLSTIRALASRPLVAFARRFDNKPSGTTSSFGATHRSHVGGVGLGEGGGNRGGRREGATAGISWGPENVLELSVIGWVPFGGGGKNAVPWRKSTAVPSIGGFQGTYCA